MKRILLIDTEAHAHRELSSALSRHFRVQSAPEPGRAIGMALQNFPDAFIVCCGGSPTGHKICRELRTHPDLMRIPLIMVLSSDRPEDRVACLELGADDCVSRPFHLAELVARLRARIRSQLNARASSAYQVAGLTILPSERLVKIRGRNARLSPKEYDVLVYLLAHAEQTVLRRKLAIDVWMNPRTTGRTIDTHFANIRRKIAGSGVVIRTLRNVGYRLEFEARRELSAAAP